jgi:hypothetical protein
LQEVLPSVDKPTPKPVQQQKQMIRTPQGDLSYMYFTPRDLINFHQQKKFTKVPQQRTKPQEGESNYIVASSPANQFIAGSQITRRPKFQQTFFKPKMINPMLSKSVNSNINKDIIQATS